MKKIDEKKKSIVCVIPARSGSKRIRNKNIKIFNGKPLIYYSIKNALNSSLFEKVIVTTDSKQIKKIAEKFGAEVPFLRDKNLSDDITSTKDVLINAIINANTKNYNFHCLLYPTAPLLNKEDLISAYNKMINEKNADGIISVRKFPSSPLRALIKKKKFLKFKYEKNQYTNSNFLENEYYDIGNFYIYKTKKILNTNNIHPNKMLGYEMPYLRSIDINELEDFNNALRVHKKII